MNLTNRQIDAVIADRVMGKDMDWLYHAHFIGQPNMTVIRSEYNRDARYLHQKIGEWHYCGPRYTANIDDAFKVVDKLTAMGYEITIECRSLDDRVTIIKREGDPVSAYRYTMGIANIPRTICLVALQVLGVPTG